MQTVLVALAGISVPWMLIAKPLVKYMNMPREHVVGEHGAG